MKKITPQILLAGLLTATAVTPGFSQIEFVDDENFSAGKVSLGRLLFHDKILSGNKNISCATCHHPLTDTGDGLSLPVGEGGRGLGMTRDLGTGEHAVHERVPRNAPPVFMLGSTDVTFMFHDGRVELDDEFPSGIQSPAGHELPATLANIVAAQAMFPVTSGTEMAGQAGENTLADAAAIGDLAGPAGVWAQLSDRLRNIPEYVELFAAAFDDVSSGADITFAHAANAIAAFEIANWRADNSPYDRYQNGQKRALSVSARRGMRLFFGKAGCGDCHNGPLLSDMEFHAIAMPQIGPGKGDGIYGREDFGREQVTGDPADRYKFRTPPLRNVALTGPWGHAGAYNTLRAVVEHHLDPVDSLWNYDTAQAVLPRREDLDAVDFDVMADTDAVAAIASANTLAPRQLKERELEDLMDFLHALTDPAALDLRMDVPMTVPSGLTMAE